MAKRKGDQKKMKGVLKAFILIVMCVAFLYLIYYQAGKVFYGSLAFDVVEVVKDPCVEFIQSRHLDRLHGQNIFHVDLKTVERLVQKEYPAVDHLRIGRRLPNRIMVSAKKRNPLAVIVVNQEEIIVDDSGMVIGRDGLSQRKLPYLIGISDLSMITHGRPLLSQRISTGLVIIKAVQANDILKKIPIYSIDLKNLSQIHINFNAFEVVLERFDIEKKMNALALLLSDSGVSLDTINYIDLRFRDPVVKKK